MTNPPHLRWPNKGLFSVTAKKRVNDDLTISEWGPGQLANIYQIKDPVLMKQALLQSIQVFMDATSLPWQAVRTSYAQSWENNTQWSLNRLSSSQIAMTNVSTMNSHRFVNILKRAAVRMTQTTDNVKMPAVSVAE